MLLNCPWTQNLTKGPYNVVDQLVYSMQHERTSTNATTATGQVGMIRILIRVFELGYLQHITKSISVTEMVFSCHLRANFSEY